LSRRRFSATELVSYVPDFAIAGTFLITWFAPLTFGPKMIGYLLTVVLLDLAIFFWLFAAIYGSLEGIWWMLWAYWLLLLNRSRAQNSWRFPTDRQVVYGR